MRMLFMIHKLTYSGAPKMLSWVANRMAEKGHEVHLVTFFSDEQARLLNEAIMVHSLNIAQSNSRVVRNTTGMMKTIIKLHKKVMEIKPDVVVSFLDSVGYVYLPIAALLTKCKLIASERVDPFSYHRKLAKFRRFSLKCCDRVVFQTEGARAFYKEHAPIYNNSIVIPNPVVINPEILEMNKHIPPPSERDNRIVTVGRLSLRQKRQDILLEAFQRIHDRYPQYRLVIYGDGPDDKKIQSQIEQMNLSHCVTLAGRVSNVEKEIFHAAAFVLTSDFEGIPNALIEAMSIGVPVVSTDCSPGGAALLIKDDKNGYLVPCRDPEIIAEKLSLLLNDPNISARFSHNCPDIIHEFSEDSIADKWEMVFTTRKK